MTPSIPPSENARRAALVAAEARAEALFDAIERAGLIRPGRTESELDDDIHTLAAERFGVEKHWHRRVVRAGSNTVTIGSDLPPLRTVGADDIVYVDLGPVFAEWEADIGRTYILGNHPGAALVAALPVIFDRVQAHYHASPDITGAELYAFALRAAAEAGWVFGGVIAGHLVAEFPHAHIPGDKVFKRVDPHNTRRMRDPDDVGRVRHWILEIHLVDPTRSYGGFYERLL